MIDSIVKSKSVIGRPKEPIVGTEIIPDIKDLGHKSLDEMLELKVTKFEWKL